MVTRDREYRVFDLAVPDGEQDGEMIIEGQAVVFNREGVVEFDDGLRFIEIVDSGAFDNAEMKDVVLNFEHEGKAAATTKNNSLKLFVKPDGLFVRADLSKTATGRELYEEVKNGVYDKMSFAFKLEKDGDERSYDRATQTLTRVIKRIRTLFDVAVVNRPFYEETKVLARDQMDSWDEIRSAAEAAEKEAEASRAAEVDRLELERFRASVLRLF